jgi:hypothetical protein
MTWTDPGDRLLAGLCYYSSLGLSVVGSGMAWRGRAKAGGDYDAGSVKPNTLYMTIFFILSLTRKRKGTGDPVRFSKQDCAIIKKYFPNVDDEFSSPLSRTRSSC